MNEGIMDIPYAPVITMKRQRVYNRTKKSYSEYIIIGTGDNETVSSNRGIGSNTELDRTDFVIDIAKVYKNANATSLSINAYGSLSLNIPDGTMLNGDKRGSGAVDLQQCRSNNTKVASGNYSFVVGNNNGASGAQSVAMGLGNISTGASSACIGNQNTSNGLSAICLGSSNNISVGGTNSVAIGYNNIIQGSCCLAAGAMGLAAVSGKSVFSSYIISTTGGATQTGIFDCGVVTTDATANVVLKSDTNEVDITNQLVLQNNNSVFVHGYVVGQVPTASSICFEIKALVRRGANASIMSLVGTPTVTKLFNDAALAACACSVAVDTTYGAFAVRVTGIAATTIHWNCTLITSEVI